MLRQKASVFVIIVLALGNLAYCQTDVNLAQGLEPYKSYMGGNIDSVSLTNGNLMLHIPLLSYPQRGGRLDLGFYLRYNAKGLRLQLNGTSGYAWVFDGVGVDVQRDQLTEQRTQRAQHHAPGDNGTATFFVSTFSTVTADGSVHSTGWAGDGKSVGSGPYDGSALGRHGIVDSVNAAVQYPNGPNCNNPALTWSPVVSTDSNGNTITTTNQGWIDTLGRLIPGEPGCITLNNGESEKGIYAGPASSVSYAMRMLPGVGTTDFRGCPGNTVGARLWVVPAFGNSSSPVSSATATMKLCYANFIVSSNFGSGGTDQSPAPYTMLQNFILPNGSMWSFNYNGTGDLISVTFPTGGSITYEWANFSFCSGMSRAITSRTVNDDTGSHKWTYSWTPGVWTNHNAPPPPTTLVVRDPGGNESQHISQSMGMCAYYETDAAFFSGTVGSGRRLKQVHTDYITFADPTTLYSGSTATAAAFPNVITTTLDNGLVTKKQIAYDDATSYTDYNLLCYNCADTPLAITETRINGQVIADSIFDYGKSSPGPLLRNITKSYFTLDDPSSIITYDAAGNKCAQTDFGYDEPGSLVGTTITQGHQASNAVRANPSSMTRWLSPTPCSPNATWTQIPTSTKYFDTGELQSFTDTKGNVTTYSYSPAFYGAYLTQTQYPDTMTNGTVVQHTISGDYDFNTGQLRTFIDQNGQSSTYNFDDMLRLTSANYPDGGQIQFNFPDFTSVEKRQLQDSSTNTWIDQFVYFDGLGRPKHTKLVDPEGDVFSDTGYDGLGRINTVLNAHRFTGSATDGSTTSTYDALGRISDSGTTDGNNVHTDYPGNSVVVTDQATRQRRTVEDGLGRIVEVDEQASSQADLTIPFGSGATGTVTIVGFENSTTIDPCADQEPPIGGPPPSCPRTIYDSGSVTITVNGHDDSTGYGINSDSDGVASDLASAINADGSAFVTAQASGSNVILTAKQLGPSTQYAWSVTSATNDLTDFGSASFSASPASGTMGGGKDPFNGGPVYLTLYSYDALGNLTHVEQHGNTTDSTQWRPRTFTYDSLSRLLTATNPESGTTQYQYDTESNLVLKTDARGVTINYDPTGGRIDALHRVRMKTYSDNTPSVTFGYDLGCCGVNPLYGVGRLTYAVAGNTELVYVYDPMGRIKTQADCPPSGMARGSCYSIVAGYNQVGAITDLSYPSGRQVHTSYNSAGRLLNLAMTGFNGTPINYTYYSAAQGDSSNANSWGYWPTGAMRLGTFGNSVAELTGYNNRLQVSTISASLPGMTLLSKTYNFYDGAGHDNGNVIGINDNLNAAKNQSYSYDTLNRIATASQADSTFNITYNIDPWSNMKESGTSNFTPVFNGQNRMQGWSYDLAGNLLADQSHSYSYDAEERISAVDTTTATYTYNPLGNRVRKDAGLSSTEYFFFGGSVISELDQSGNFSDYIFAAGKRIARANNFEHQLHISGQECSNCGWQWYQYNFSNLGTIAGHTIQAGDALRWLQWSNGGSKGGMIITFTDGTESWTTGQDLVDQNGEEIMRGSLSINQWEYRIANLGPVIGKTISQIRLYADGTTTPGQWDLYFQDVVFTNADGSVQPLFSQNPIVPTLSGFGSTGMTQTSVTIHDCVGAGCAPVNTTTYYHTDLIGSSRLITDGYGYSVWQGTFAPFGEEINPQNTTNHYKFTGKERDSESGAPGNGLDYFGARYYSATLGRFMTPDWSSAAVPVPYADYSDPQTLNLYSYVRDVPTSRSDPSGHYEVNLSGCQGKNSVKCQKKYDKKVAEFEKQLQAALQSRDPRVRRAAEAYGAKNEKNGVHVGFADLGSGIKGKVDPSNSGKGKAIDIEVTFNTNLSGKSLRETVAHEGTHVSDDAKFLTSYDFSTGKYDSGSNPYHLQTEFNAYSAGAAVTQEHGFGPNDGRKIVDFIYSQPAYNNQLFDPVFPNTAQYPQAQQAPPAPEDE